MNVFMRIGFGSTIKFVSFDESWVVTFNGKFIWGSGIVIEAPRVGETTWSATYMGSSSMGLRFLRVTRVAEVIDVKNWQIDNSRVLRWIISLIEGNSSVSSMKSSIQSTFRFRISKTIWFAATTRDTVMEVGTDNNGLHHEAT
ncbi:hypothetical protein Tco_0627933 [Tanacetum coccineum]|uniref:Uncharacterized protein n=1 Tax=Tanacetum coccineum TaxID=301880 RepID=A0ABQ4WPM0_9ASTR